MNQIVTTACHGDYVFTTHRGQAPQVARGLDPKRIMAELYCRRSGYNKGKSYHVTDIERGPSLPESAEKNAPQW